MKKVLVIAVFAMSLSCSDKSKTEKEEVATEQEQTPKVVSDPIAEGKSLIEGSDCLGCHKLDEKMVGPSYKEVAQKYENTPENVEMLAEKILKGSSGVWGDVPMPAHGFSKENAKFMAQYILSSK